MKTTNEIFKEVTKELGFEEHKHSEMSGSDYWMIIDISMKRYAKQFKKSAK